MEDAGISDHLPILFSVSLDVNTPSQSSLPRWTRIFTDCSSKEFSSKYELLGATQDMNTLTGLLDINKHLSIFNNTCSNILDSTAPLKMKKHKHNPIPWHNDTTRSLRQTFRRAERKWKKDRLQVSYEILQDSLPFRELPRLQSVDISQS